MTFITTEGSPTSGSVIQQMNVFGHEDVSHDHEAIAPPGLLQHSCQQIAALGSAQLRLAAVAAARNEMQVVLAVEAFQASCHRFTIRSLFPPVCDLSIVARVTAHSFQNRE
jgi:hypothetical protein